MAKIDTSGWKPFVVGELFPSMVKPPVLHARQVVETDEGIPYVVRTKFNNGIKCRVHPVSDVTPSPAGVITWGAENAAFFYQAEEFLSGRDIYYVDTRPYSATTCMFLAACLQTVVHKYPYNYGLFPDLLKEEQIRLPVDAAGEPNWAYMDEYMSAVMGESGASLESLRQTDGEKHALSVSGWQEFIIGVYGDNVIEKHGINRDRTGDREKTRYLCGKQGIFTRDRALIRPGFIRQLETRASTRSASFFMPWGALEGPTTAAARLGHIVPVTGRNP